MKVTALEKANDYYNVFKPQLTPKKNVGTWCLWWFLF